MSSGMLIFSVLNYAMLITDNDKGVKLWLVQKCIQQQSNGVRLGVHKTFCFSYYIHFYKILKGYKVRDVY